MPQYITSTLLNKTPCIRHGFFTRKGGVSTGIYASLNCGPGSGDNPEHVIENRRLVCEALGTKDASQLCTLFQSHSNQVVTLQDKQHDPRSPADAMVTRTPGVILGILTADCTPVLFADAEAKVIGAAHAGWKGAISGILENTVAAMEALGAKRDRIQAAIGATIHQESYEVGPEFITTFMQKDPSYSKFFMPSDKPSHHLFDLPGFVTSILQKQSLANIDNIQKNTYADAENFFSWRRTCHEGNKDYGRLISVITLI